MQSKDWAFDFVAYAPGIDEKPCVLGEVKKTSAEVRRLVRDMLAFSATPTIELPKQEPVRNNSLRKWQSLLNAQPRVLWIVGPATESYVFFVSYPSPGKATLLQASPTALAYAGVA
jgi:hypothetical protein